MVRLQLLGEKDFIQLTIRELFKFLPEAHYDLPQIPIQEFFEFALRCDPVFKIQSIPEDQLYLKDEKLKFTRFEYLSSVFARRNKKRWSDYKILRPSSNPEKKFYREGPISCMEKPTCRTKRLAIEKLKESFKGAILIIPVILNTINTSRVNLKRFDRNGYCLRVRSNNNGSKEEVQISNSEPGRSQTERPPGINWLKYTERHIVFSSLNGATTMPLTALNETPRMNSNSIIVKANNETQLSETLITELSAMNEHSESLSEREDNKKKSEPMITELSALNGDSDSEEPDNKKKCSEPLVTELSALNGDSDSEEPDNKKICSEPLVTELSALNGDSDSEEADNKKICFESLVTELSALNGDSNSEEADNKKICSEPLVTELSTLNEHPKNFNGREDNKTTFFDTLITELPAMNEHSKSSSEERADNKRKFPELLIIESPKKPRLSNSKIKPKPIRSVIGQTPEDPNYCYTFSAYEIAIVDNILKSYQENEPSDMPRLNNTVHQITSADTPEGVNSLIATCVKNLYFLSPKKLEDLATEQLESETERPPTPSAINVALSEEPPINPTNTTMEDQLLELFSPSASSTFSSSVSEEPPINPSNSTMEDQLPELFSPPASSTLNTSVSEELPKVGPSNTTVDPQLPELSRAASIKFDVSVSVGPPKILSFSMIEKQLPELLHSLSASNGSVPNGDSNTSDELKKVHDAVNIVKENIQRNMNEAISTKMNKSNSTKTNYVGLLKTYIKSRSLIDVTYSIDCNMVNPCEPNRCRYSCLVKLLDKIIGNSFPLECASPEEAMQIAAKIALDHVQKCDALSLSVFFSIQSLFSF